MPVSSWLKRVFGWQDNQRDADKPPAQVISDRDAQVLASSAQRLVVLVNESLQLSNNSRNPETKVSRLHFAKAKIEELKAMAAQHRFLKITAIDVVQSSIRELEHEYTDAGYYSEVKPADINSAITYNRTIGDLQSVPLSERVDDDLIVGAEFCATLQLRTPLRVLKRHKEQFTGPGIPPAIADEQRQGIWVVKTKTFRELGIDIDEWPMGTMASDVGQIPSDGGDYLKLLLAIRGIVERSDSISARLTDLKTEIRNERWIGFVRKLGGEKAIADRFFPRFIDTLPGLQKETVATLWELNMTTPTAIATAPDEKLLALKGIGPAKLKKIREVCAGASDPESEYVDLVER